MNNNIPYPNEGIDIQAPNPIIRDTKTKLYNDAQPALEGAGQPSINTNSNIPSINYGTGQYDERSGGYIPNIPDGGTVLSDTTISYGTSGIVERDNLASRNTTSDWEAQVRAADSQRIAGRTVFNTPPSSGGFAPYVPVHDGKVPTKEELEKERNKTKISNLNNRLRNLQNDERTLSLKLSSIQRAISTLKTELEAFTTSKDGELQ